jgi:hypothetical protein
LVPRLTIRPVAVHEGAPRRFVWNALSTSPGAGLGLETVHGWVKAGRRPPEGLGFDAVANRHTLAKGLSATDFFGWQP